MRRVVAGPLRLAFSDSEIDGLCNDLSMVFDERAIPDERQVADLTLRLHGSLMRLTGAASDPRLCLEAADAVALAKAIHAARTHLNRENPSPRNSITPRVVLVQLARVVSDLLDALGAVGLLEPADLLDDAHPPSGHPTPGCLPAA
ncbi:DUF6415 family natural product biosynthesis protein [Streptomyces sp. NPDC048565]|uniref:DUF6415 family natural product biosynthesis protein n=1 Tax=Streptomyces sp. NPDC048565 TaxID=3155266 RepID=UPI00341440A8